MMTDLTDMTIEYKLSTIRELISKAKKDNNYLNRIILPEGMSAEEFFLDAQVKIDTAAKWIQPKRMENLQEAEYAEAYAHIQSILDGILNRFPEYTPSESFRHI